MDNLDAIALSCPKCGRTVKVKSDAAGKKVRCPAQGCDTIIDIPGSKQLAFGSQAQIMTNVGVLFVIIATAFTFHQMKVAWGWLISVALVGLVVLSEILPRTVKSAAVALFIPVGVSAALLFFLVERKGDATTPSDTPQSEWSFIVGSALFFALSGYLVARAHRTWSHFDLSNTAKRLLNLESGMVWSALIVSSITFLWVDYYKFLTRGGSEEIVWRRLVFTFSFVVIGVTCSVLGRKSPVPFLAVTGLIYMAAGVVKALAYDLLKTNEWQRIAIFASCGVVLVLGGFLVRRPASPSVEANSEFAAVIEDQ